MKFLTGITLIRNGDLLGYPFRECIRSLAAQCEEVLVNVGDSIDGTLDVVRELQIELKNIKIYAFKWDMSNTGDGSELARQANLLLPFVDSEWCLYLQADEFVHYEPHHQFYKYIGLQSPEVSQIELYRTYFYRNLETRLPSEELYLGRIFRPGTHVVGGDGMHLVRLSGEVNRSSYWIYHYSRMGSEEAITKRVRTLDLLFHPTEVVSQMIPFKYDNNLRTIDYNGSHPNGIDKFYRSID